MNMPRKKITIPIIRRMKKMGEQIVALTSADFITTRLLDEARMDIILVGDSLGTTILGYESTIPVTMNEMLHHVKAVTRAKPSALVVADMPFGSYQPSSSHAVQNAIRLIQEGGADAVKLEGGEAQTEKIKAIVETGIPVMAHLGLLPQSVLQEGGYRVQGKTAEQIKQLKNDLRAVERAGAFACVLEYIRAEIAGQLTKQTNIPTIGIGSGRKCDGQILVTSDLLGFQTWLSPKAVRRYANLGKIAREAFEQYVKDVRTGKFPGKKESFD